MTAQAHAVANDTPFGLAAYFYARDRGQVWRVGEGPHYGIDEFLEVKYLCMGGV
jgi:succinate-semialdehyde dehydrogenase/glutarate-semialdehyde dehydrogenase